MILVVVNLEFDMAILFIRDMERSLEFYVNLLGFQIEGGKTIFEASKEQFVVVSGYGVKLGLHLSNNVSSGCFKLVFNVGDVNKFMEFLESRGISYGEKSQIAPGLYEIVIEDPNGHKLSFVGRG